MRLPGRDGNTRTAPGGSLEASTNRADHLLEVARCPILEQCLEAAQPSHPCAGVVLTQWSDVSPTERIATWRARHQLPEPWRGRINVAPILFVSSNPSISRYHGAYQPDRGNDERVSLHPSPSPNSFARNGV